MRRLYIEGRYHETIQLADRITLSRPDDEGALFYRSQAQLRLSEAAKVSPIPRVRPRFIVLPPESRQRETLTPVYKRRRESVAAARAAAESAKAAAADQDGDRPARRSSQKKNRGRSGGTGSALLSIVMTGLGLAVLGALVWAVFALFGRKKSEKSTSARADDAYTPTPIADYEDSDEGNGFDVPTRAELTAEELREGAEDESDSEMFVTAFEKGAFEESAEDEGEESAVSAPESEPVGQESTGADISIDLPTETDSESPDSEVPAEESVGIFDTEGGSEFDIENEPASEQAAADDSVEKVEPAEPSKASEDLLGLGAFKIAEGDDTTGPDLPSLIEDDADSASAMDAMEGSGFFGGDDEKPQEEEALGGGSPEASSVDFEGLSGKTGWADLKISKAEPGPEKEEESLAVDLPMSESPESSHEDLPLSVDDISISAPAQAESEPESSGIDLGLITGARKGEPESSIEPEHGESESLIAADSLEAEEEGMESMPMLVGHGDGESDLVILESEGESGENSESLLLESEGDSGENSESMVPESEGESGEEFGSSQGESPSSVGVTDESSGEAELKSGSRSEIDETHGHRPGEADATVPEEETGPELDVGSLRDEEMSDTETAVGLSADDGIIRIGEGELEGPSDIPPTEKSRPMDAAPERAQPVEVHAFHADETVHLDLEQPDADETIFPEPETLESNRDQAETAQAQTKPSPTKPKVSFDPFEKESDLGFEAYDKEQWDKAVHHLSIAAALRPDAVKVREQLRTARRRRKGNPA